MASILIVDDRPTNRQFLVTLLGYGGHRLLEASDGAEALQITLAERPQLVITDILMPTMDGYEFVQKLRAEPTIAATPVIFYSAAYSVPEARALAETCGVRTVLPKPSEPQVILAAVSHELGEAKSRVPSASAPMLSATGEHEFLRIGKDVDAYLSDLHSAKQVIDRIVDRGDELFNDRELLRPLAERFAGSIDGIQAVTARLAALEELSLRLLAARSPAPMVQLFAELAAPIMGARGAAVCVLDSREASVSHIAAVGLDQQRLRAVALDRATLPGSLLEANRPVRLEGAAAASGPLAPGLSVPVSLLGLPLRNGTRLHGWVLFVDKLGGSDFGQDDERLAASMAAQLSVVYENAVLYETVRRHAALLQLAVSAKDQAGRELEESERRFRQLSDNIPEVFYLTNVTASQMFYVSPAYEDIWGRSCESLYERPQSWAESVHPEDRDRAYRVFEELATTGRCDFEYRIERPDGDVRWIRARAFPILNEEGAIYRLAGVATDVTEKKQSELNLVRMNRALRMLSSCNLALVRVQNEDALLQSICEIAVEIGGYRVARVGLTIDDADKTVMFRAHFGALPDFLASARASWSADRTEGMGPAGRAIRSGEVVVVDDFAKEPSLGERARHFEEARFGDSIYLPLLGPTRTEGVLILHSSEGNRASEDELDLLRELANDLALGIHTIRAQTEREKADAQLQASLREQQALLKEVHHRTKNNMQVISSLLRLESSRVDDQATRGVLAGMQNRIQSMAALHETLYRSGSFAEVDLSAYLRQLVGQLSRSLVSAPGQVRLELDLAPVPVGLDQAIPCGLIVNELVSNAFKHAFPTGGAGEIRLELRAVEGGRLRLRVKDDGVGLPKDYEAKRGKSLGLQLVSDLTRQLGGTLESSLDQGVCVDLTFPQPVPSAAATKS